jgi:transposase
MIQLASQNLAIDQGPKRRGGYRRWPEALKRQIVAESYEPGTSVSVVARRHDVNANQVFGWRQLFGTGGGNKKAMAEFVPLGIVGLASVPPSGMITIDLGNKINICVDRDVDERALDLVLAAVRRLP